MSILVDKGTKLVVTGLTGREGSFHGLNNKRYGTDVVAGVTPGKGGLDVEGIPVFNTIGDAVDQAGANTAMIFVPPRFAADSINFNEHSFTEWGIQYWPVKLTMPIGAGLLLLQGIAKLIKDVLLVTRKGA